MLQLSQRTLLIFFWIIIISILLVHNWDIPYWDQDEAAYAGFGRNILKYDDWLIPDYMNSDVHRKPPFHFWSIAWSYRIFGYNEFAVRFPAFLSILGTLLIVYYQVKKFFDIRMAVSAVWILATSFLVMALAKVSVTDATVLCSMTICAWSLINIVKRYHWHWVLYFWLGIVLGTLTKGPPVVLFSGALGLYLLIVISERKSLLRLHPWFWGPIALLPLFYWGYRAYQQDGGVFINWMLDWYIFKRVDGQVFGQTGPPGTHFILLMGFFLLYIGYFLPAWYHTFKTAIIKRDSWSIILVGYLIAGWFFFEFTPSKLPAYAIGAHVPIAIMIAWQMNRGNTHKAWIIGQYMVLTFAGLAASIICIFYREMLPLWDGALLWIALLWTLVAALGLIFSLNEKKEQPFANAIRKFLLNSVLLIGIWLLLPPLTKAVSASYQVKNAMKLIPIADSTVFIFTNPGDQPSLPVYMESIGKHPVDMVHRPLTVLDSVMEARPRAIFLLNKEQCDHANILYSMKAKIVSTPIIDRKGKNEYFIVYDVAPLNPVDSY